MQATIPQVSKQQGTETMEYSEEEVSEEPVSPTGQYFNSSVLSIAILAVLEFKVPIDDSPTMTLLENVFLPINPRFSSIMIEDKHGVKQWKKVQVRLKDHVNVPVFPEGKSLEFYDQCLSEYLSKIAMDQLPQSRPLWEIHIIKYPTSNASGNLVFKLHHALGDGYSLMGALLSCLQRADNPSLPLSFPSRPLDTNTSVDSNGVFKLVPKFFSGVCNTVVDFGWSLLQSSVLKDDRTPIRSGDDGVEFRPVTISTMIFSLDDIKQIKANLDATINDVICGVIFLGTRVYMEEMNHKQRNANATALVLLNTRNITGYKSIKEMVEPNTTSAAWGNQFGFIHVSVPELSDAAQSLNNPLDFVFKAQNIIRRKRNSLAVYLTGRLLETMRSYRGPEAAAQYIHSTLKNSSMTVSNIIGPVEEMALANHPIKGLYFMVVGVPESLTITMISYMRKLTVAVGTEKGLIDPTKFKSCVEKAFDMIFNAAVKSV